MKSTEVGTQPRGIPWKPDVLRQWAQTKVKEKLNPSASGLFVATKQAYLVKLCPEFHYLQEWTFCYTVQHLQERNCLDSARYSSFIWKKMDTKLKSQNHQQRWSRADDSEIKISLDITKPYIFSSLQMWPWIPRIWDFRLNRSEYPGDSPWTELVLVEQTSLHIWKNLQDNEWFC